MLNGSPADCARIGLELIPDCDMVLSGINDGGNLGGATVYSGTVAAAMEASMARKARRCLFSGTLQQRLI
jgi:Predicted acid phosphatase